MPPKSSSARVSAAPFVGAPAYAAVAGFFLLFCVAWDRFLLPGTRDLWDARVYARAFASWQAGGDPYSLSFGLPFVYPPVFLYAQRALAYLAHGNFAWFLYLALLVVATLSIPWLLAKAYLRSAWFTPLIAFVLFVFQPKLIGEIVLLSGNIGTLLYSAALAAGALGLRRQRWLPFYAVVVIASWIKPPFLDLLLIPLLCARRQYLRSLCAILVSAAGYLLQVRLAASLFARFRAAVVNQVVVREDAGFGIYAWLLKLSHRLPMLRGAGASLGYVVILAIPLVALFLLRRRRFEPQDAALWTPAVLVLAILTNPRLQDYDADVAILPAIFLCVECFRTSQPSAARNLVVALCASVFLVLLSREPYPAIYVFLLGSLAIAIFRLARSSARRPVPVEGSQSEVVA